MPNSGKNCKKFPDRVIYNSKIGSIPPQNWKATWHRFSNVSYADIVKGTSNQAYGKNSVNCPLKVNSPVKVHKVQNIYSKATNVDTHVVNTNFNTNKCVANTKTSSVPLRNVWKPRGNSFKVSNNCFIKGKNFNNDSCNGNNVTISSLYTNDEKLQTSCVFEDVNRFASLQQVSDDNTGSALSDSSTVKQNNVKNDYVTCPHDVLSESSNTRVAHANCSVAKGQVNKNCPTITNSLGKSKTLDSVKSLVSTDTVENPSVTVTPVTYVNSQGSKGSSNDNQGVKNSVDSNSDKYDLDLRFRPRHREAVAKATNCELFRTWDSQTADKYGFIPLSEMIVPKTNRKKFISSHHIRHTAIHS